MQAISGPYHKYQSTGEESAEATDAFFLNTLIFHVLGKNCFKCVHNWELFAKGEPIYLVKSKQKTEV